MFPLSLLFASLVPAHVRMHRACDIGICMDWELCVWTDAHEWPFFGSIQLSEHKVRSCHPTVSFSSVSFRVSISHSSKMRAGLMLPFLTKNTALSDVVFGT